MTGGGFLHGNPPPCRIVPPKAGKGAEGSPPGAGRPGLDAVEQGLEPGDLPGVSGGDVPAFAGVVPQVVELFRRIVSHFGVGRFVPGRGVARGDVFPAVGDDRERLREVDADDVFRPFGVGSEECPEVVPAVGRGPFGQRGSAERGQRGVEVDMAQQGV